MQDVPPDLLNFEETEELDPDSRLHQQEEDKRLGVVCVFFFKLHVSSYTRLFFKFVFTELNQIMNITTEKKIKIETAQQQIAKT